MQRSSSAFLIVLILLCGSCGYRVGESGPLVAYRSISVPYVEGDLRGELTAALIRELTATGGFDYCAEGGSLELQVRLLEVREDNVGFRYYRNQQGRRTHSVIPTETRLNAVVEVTVIETLSNKTLVGPISITASVDFDHDYYSSRNAVNIYSLGQVTDYDAAYETAFRPLNLAIARKVASYLKDCW